MHGHKPTNQVTAYIRPIRVLETLHGQQIKQSGDRLQLPRQSGESFPPSYLMSWNIEWEVLQSGESSEPPSNQIAENFEQRKMKSTKQVWCFMYSTIQVNLTEQRYPPTRSSELEAVTCSYGQCFGSGSGIRGLLDPDSESGSRGLKKGKNVK